jgi:PleD family two-component response regulator
MARRLPSFGYVLPNSAAAGTWLGTVDFLTLPVANARAVETLHALVPDVASVMVVSGDLDVTMDLRAELSGSGIDLAVVDARTAIELCSSEPPDAVILHVSPTSSDSFRVLAAVHTHTSANIPIVFLMDPVAQPREEAFLSAGTSLIAEYGRLRPDELARRLASDLAAQPVVPSH